MSQENIELMRRGFEAWNAGDIEAALELADDDLVTRRIPPLPDPATWHGHDGLVAVTSEWTEMFEGFEQRAEEYIDAGDHVVIRVRQEVRAGGSSATVGETFWFVCGIRDGKLVTFDIYGDREQAFAAVGLDDKDR